MWKWWRTQLHANRSPRENPCITGKEQGNPALFAFPSRFGLSIVAQNQCLAAESLRVGTGNRPATNRELSAGFRDFVSAHFSHSKRPFFAHLFRCCWTRSVLAVDLLMEGTR